MFKLNIGAMTSPKASIQRTSRALRHGEVSAALGFANLRITVFDRFTPADGSEETFVVTVVDENPLGLYSVRHRINGVAAELFQDCIAIVPMILDYRIGAPSRWVEALTMGRLFGPRSQDWGAFDASKFLLKGNQ